MKSLLFLFRNKLILILILLNVCVMCLYFSNHGNKHYVLPVIYLNNCVHQFAKEVQHLGVMIHSSMKTKIDVARQTHKFYMQAILLLRNFGIALMMSSAHCSSHIVLICIVVSYGLALTNAV